MDYLINKHSILTIYIFIQIWYDFIPNNSGSQLLIYWPDEVTTIQNTYYVSVPSIASGIIIMNWSTPQTLHLPVLIVWVLNCCVTWKYTHNMHTTDHIIFSESENISERCGIILWNYIGLPFWYKNNNINKFVLSGVQMTVLNINI